MGNEQSGEAGFGQMEALQMQLDKLETSLSSLEAAHDEQLAREATGADANPSGPLVICGARLTCREKVRLLVGPVVGRVDSRSAVVLVEADADCTLTFVTCLIDKRCPDGREKFRQDVSLKARRPGIGVIEGLSPNTRSVRRAERSRMASRRRRGEVLDASHGGAAERSRMHRTAAPRRGLGCIARRRRGEISDASHGGAATWMFRARAPGTSCCSPACTGKTRRRATRSS